MSDDSELWRDYRTAQKLRRATRVPIRQAAILALMRKGFDIEMKTPYHFRVNSVLDIWPTHNRWHDLVTNKRGGAKDIAKWAEETIQRRYPDSIPPRLDQ